MLLSDPFNEELHSQVLCSLHKHAAGLERLLQILVILRIFRAAPLLSYWFYTGACEGLGSPHCHSKDGRGWWLCGARLRSRES